VKKLPSLPTALVLPNTSGRSEAPSYTAIKRFGDLYRRNCSPMAPRRDCGGNLPPQFSNCGAVRGARSNNGAQHQRHAGVTPNPWRARHRLSADAFELALRVCGPTPGITRNEEGNPVAVPAAGFKPGAKLHHAIGWPR
jgi:hypothetical protein